ncbi:hypothetical protein K0M31_018321 [Melipona bicolor]|uniref:Uncharacterized protein n=1 Tax=Melipona bicolor TaxID=60889 RepID=A0AA40KRJ4_9HYME|nr:hypothetical protein K0M31_018321 [Melipona bicolor]
MSARGCNERNYFDGKVRVSFESPRDEASSHPSHLSSVASVETSSNLYRGLYLENLQARFFVVFGDRLGEYVHWHGRTVLFNGQFATNFQGANDPRTIQELEPIITEEKTNKLCLLATIRGENRVASLVGLEQRRRRRRRRRGRRRRGTITTGRSLLGSCSGHWCTGGPLGVEHCA